MDFNNNLTQAGQIRRAKFNHRRGRHTNIDLKALCHERGLSAKGTKRELMDRLEVEDRRPEQLRREAKLKILMEDRFKKARSPNDEGLGFAMTKLNLKGGRGRSFTYPPPGSKAASGQPRTTGNRFLNLVDVDMEESGEVSRMNFEQAPRGILPINGAAKVEDTVSVQMNKLQLHIHLPYKQDIEDITRRIYRLPLPTSYCCKGSGETMSLDFSRVVRGDAGSFSVENSEDGL